MWAKKASESKPLMTRRKGPTDDIEAGSARSQSPFEARLIGAAYDCEPRGGERCLLVRVDVARREEAVAERAELDPLELGRYSAPLAPQ